MDSGAERFKRWVQTSGTQLTRKARTQTGIDGYGDPTYSEAQTAFMAFVHPFEDRLLQTDSGVFIEQMKALDVALDETMNMFDKILIGDDEYEVQVIETRKTHKRISAKRMVKKT